jgi:uncharacterized protein
VQIWHETERERKPRWVTEAARWPLPTTATALHLRHDGSLTRAAPAIGEGQRSYPYPRASSSVNVVPNVSVSNNPVEAGEAWTAEPDPSGRLVWTTRALSRDLPAVGTASLDLWLSSTAGDVDLQATLAEVRPDGQEMYVQRGWLRASHRRLDEGASTATQPVHTHRREDARPLQPGQPTFVRLELFPFAHLFRAGSSLRISIEAPTGATGLWSFTPTGGTATNTVHSNAARPSRLVLGVPAALAAPAERPACGAVRMQPCRASSAPVPPGSEDPLGPERAEDQQGAVGAEEQPSRE